MLIDQILFFLTSILFVLCVWKLLPMSLYIIWPRPKCYFHKNSDATINEKWKPTIQEIASKIEGLSFTRLGIKVEKPPLWQKALYELALASTKEQTFASISVINNTVIYYFYTPFTTGQIVFTANGAFPAITSDDLLQSAVASTGPEDLLAIHRIRLEKFISNGFHPYQIYNQDSRINATNQYYNSRQVRKLMHSSAFVYLTILIIGSSPFVYFLVHLLA